jgi:hypothetical protein
VTIKRTEFCENGNLKISGCEYSFIYIDNSVDYLSITNCSNCTIFVAAVKNITAVDKCEKVNVTVASNMIRIGNTLDSKFFTFSTYEPILYGDNKSIFMAPNNANYVELFSRIKDAKIDTSTKS